MQVKKKRDSNRSTGNMLEGAAGPRKNSSCFSNIKIFLIAECALMLAQGTVGAYLVSYTLWAPRERGGGEGVLCYPGCMLAYGASGGFPTRMRSPKSPLRRFMSLRRPSLTLTVVAACRVFSASVNR